MFKHSQKYLSSNDTIAIRQYFWELAPDRAEHGNQRQSQKALLPVEGLDTMSSGSSLTERATKYRMVSACFVKASINYPA